MVQSLKADLAQAIANVFEKANEVRSVEIDGQLWVSGKDVRAVLGVANHNDALSALDEDERRGGQRLWRSL